MRAAAVLMLSFASCGLERPPDEPAEPLTAQHKDELTYLNRGVFWAPTPPSTPLTIPSCWTTTGFEAEKQIAVNAIRATWGRVTNLNFTFKNCAPGEPPSIRIQVDQATDSGGGGSSVTGKASSITESEKPGTNLPRGVSMAWSINTLASGFPIDRIRYLAVHEFGHALNFVHEQDSPASACGGIPWDATQIASWDQYSVMLSGSSGCTNNRYGNALGYLSPLDRSGARSKYGTRRVTAAGDFAGQGRASVGVWRPSTGVWYVNDGVTPATTWGVATDFPVPGDYNGDGRVDTAVWRPETGTWFINDQQTAPKVWGERDDLPVPCDYNGDGKMDRAMFRPSNRTWYIDDNQTAPKIWGERGDFLVPADYTGDGRCDIAVFRPSTGRWYINAANGAYDRTLGADGGVPVPGDYAGEGLARPAAWYPANGRWVFATSPASQPGALFLGSGADIPVPGNYNGDGIDVPAIFHPQTGNTFFWRLGGFVTFWGEPLDVPTTAARRLEVP